MNIAADLTALAPIWVTSIAAFVVLLLTVAQGYRRPAAVGGGHLAFVSLAALTVVMWLFWQHEGRIVAFSGAIVVDGISASFGFITALGAWIAVILSAGYLREHDLAQGEFFALVLLATVGMLVLTMAGDLLVLFLGIEIMSLAVYILAGFRRALRRAQEAALKYFVYGAFASAFVIYGIALLYGAVGAHGASHGNQHAGLAFKTLHEVFAAGVSPLAWVGVAMVLSGLGFKIAAVPFHMWAPDVYEGAPTPSTAFMAVGVKAAAFAGLCRFVEATLLNGTHGSTETSIQIMEILAILTMLVGNLLAVRQTQIKRMLAYSSIAHAGYLLIGISAFLAQPKGQAMEAIAYYLLGYTATTLGAFGVIVAFERRDDKRVDLSIERLAGAAHRYPALGLAMAVFMFALAGVPPTTGFFGKLAIFSAAISAERVGVVIVAVLASAVGAFYYLRVLVVMYMRANSTDETRVPSVWLSTALWVCAGITVVVGLIPELYLGFARRVLGTWLSS